MKSQETYLQFCERLHIQPGPEAARAFADDVVSLDEIKRHYANEFVSSLHPDGGNLAGYHGVEETHDKGIL